MDWASGLVYIADVKLLLTIRMSMKFDPQNKAVFAAKGLLHLKGAVPKSKVTPIKDGIFDELARLRIRENGKWHTKQFENVPPFKVTGSISQKIRPQSSYGEIIPPELVTYMSELSGLKFGPAQPHAQVLITPPQRGEWSVPHLGWHLDVASPSRDEIPGVQAFVLLDDVAPRGGGTLAIAGSHRLHDAKGGAAFSVHQVFAEDPLYAGLFAADGANRERFLRPHLVRGVEVQVVEMCGRAGDVYLMDMRVLHAPALNATKNARLMLTSRYLNPKSL